MIASSPGAVNQLDDNRSRLQLRLRVECLIDFE
jgi:hypothetical protein